MCIVILAWQVDPQYPLLVAANRDEFHHRPAEAARWRGDVLCGLDLVAGGTWLGISRAGRFATVTNFREPIIEQQPANRSRGMLPLGFLQSEQSSLEFLQGIEGEQQEYGGFNLLVSDGQELLWMSNRGAEPQSVAPGYYALSNGQLYTDWPKARRGRTLLQQLVEQRAQQEIAPQAISQGLLDILEDDTLPDDDALPDTGVGLAMERLVAPIFIQAAAYGTRASSALMQQRDGSFNFAEQRWQADGTRLGEPQWFA